MVSLDLKPDPKPNLDRNGFRTAWRSLQLLKEPHQAQLADIERAQGALLDLTTAGDEPVAWCEDCRAPFFDGDDFVSSGEEDISHCRYDADGNRIGRCFREIMEG